jgi:hypothetical protein
MQDVEAHVGVGALLSADPVGARPYDRQETRLWVGLLGRDTPRWEVGMGRRLSRARLGWPSRTTRAAQVEEEPQAGTWTGLGTRSARSVSIPKTTPSVAYSMTRRPSERTRKS